MALPSLPKTHSSVIEILKFARSTLGMSRITLCETYPQIKDRPHQPRQHYIEFEIGRIIIIYNFFDICDICLIEFNNLNESSECYDLCNRMFTNKDTHIWFDNDTLVQFYVNRVGTRSFRFCLNPLCSVEVLQINKK